MKFMRDTETRYHNLVDTMFNVRDCHPNPAMLFTHSRSLIPQQDHFMTLGTGYLDNHHLRQGSLKPNQFPVEQEYVIQQQQPSILQHIGDSSNLSFQDVLILYIRDNNGLQTERKNPAIFLKKLHNMLSHDTKCKCNEYGILISHYENCDYYFCHICKPVREFCSAGTVHSGFGNAETDHLKAINDSKTIGHGTYVVEDDIPPPKRMRMDDCYLAENVPSGLVAGYVDEPFRSKGTSHCKKWSEGPLCDDGNEEAMKSEQLFTSEEPIQAMEKEHLNYPENRNGASLATIHTRDDTLIVGHDNSPFRSKELNFGISNSHGPKSDIIPILEKPNVIQEKGEIQSTTKPGLYESKVGVDARDCVTYHHSRSSLKDQKIPVSLVDFLNSEQIEDHIDSLNLSTSQRIMMEPKDNAMENCVGENTCQLCTMDKLVFSPEPLYCSNCSAPIKHNLIYYWSQDEMGSRHCFCTRCLKESRGGSISFHGLSISKALLQKERNNAEMEEWWVQCDKCGRWQHQICGLYNAKGDTEGKAKYVCPFCRLEEIKIGEHVPLPAAFGAKDLPRTKLSDHIEQRLLRQLMIEREDRAKMLGKDFDEVPGTAELVVRVVLSVNKDLRVKQDFLDIFPDENYPAEFPYKSKAVLLFQKIEGVDVCLFIMYVQEYGSECGDPNQRCVYISYLDSVKYFRPEVETATGEALRTFVYKEILIGYLDYCKKRGFTTCYIWACPPLKGEDYIFYCHPATQKTPKQDKLRQWYTSMLKKAVEEDIVEDYTSLYDQFFIPNGECNTKITAARLPYFDGNYWSGAAEDMIRKLKESNGGESQGKVKKLLTKRTLKAMGHHDLTIDATTDILVMQKLGQTILPVKEDFLVVHLSVTCKNCHNPILSGGHWFCNQCKKIYLCTRCVKMGENFNGTKTHTTIGGQEHLLSQVVVNDMPADTAETDSILDNDIFENRHTFLSFCQRNHYQFDTLRRAKHSTIMLLYDLHKQMPLTIGTSCSICHEDIMVGALWHCEICPKFTICLTCFNRKGGDCHDHKLIQHLPRAHFGANENQAQQKKLFQVVVRNAMDHAFKCGSAKSNPCSYPRCLQIKRFFHHANQCKIGVAGRCRQCRKVWIMIRVHSKTCKDSCCRVPHCMYLKRHAEMCPKQSDNRRRTAVKNVDAGDEL